MSKQNKADKKRVATDKKSRKISYRNWVTPEFVEEVSKQIVLKLMIEKKYRDPKYSARQLAREIGVNPRQISAVVAVRFQQNYSKLVSDMRVREAMYMFQDSHFDDMTIEDVAINVGFTTRQSFYADFNRLSGMTPREYRILHHSGADDANQEA